MSSDTVQLRFALDSAGIGDWDEDLRANVTVRSPAHDACFGYTIPPAVWDVDTFIAHVHPDDRGRVALARSATLAGERDYDVEFRVVWPDGSLHWLRSTARAYFDGAANPSRLAGMVVDIDAKKRLEESERLSAIAMASTTDSILIADARTSGFPIVYANAAFGRLTGYATSELIGQSCRILQGTDNAQPEIADVRVALAAGRACCVTLRNYRKDGTLFWNRLALSPVRDGAGVVTYFVGVQSDVTKNKQLEAELLHGATHDALTGLPNQDLLEGRLEAALRDADRNGTLVAVAFADIDRLKRVNDSLGHAGGDVLINAVASRLSGSVRTIDTVARYASDEFVIVFRDLPDAEAAGPLISRLRHVLGAPLVVGGIELVPSATVGIAIYPHDATGVSQLIRAAAAAMYAIKATDRGSFRFFDQATMRPGADPLASEGALRHALTSGQLALDYQPIYDARTGRVAALEALLRWHDPARGVVAPDDFVPLAEESGLIVPIGEWVLREVCRQHRAWQSAGVPTVPVAINVSIVQLRRSDFATRFSAVVAETGIDPHSLVLEVTESILMDNAQLFGGVLAELRATGARVSIDDFGTGFSSLSYLKWLSVDSLKIDKSFVDDLAKGPHAVAICKAIVTLAHSVGLTAVAEGIESVEQATLLRGIGCDEFQGFYFAHPKTADATERLLRSEGPLGVTPEHASAGI